MDVDGVENVDDMLSILGYFTYIGDSLVTLKSKKCNMVARSSCEVKYRV